MTSRDCATRSLQARRRSTGHICSRISTKPARRSSSTRSSSPEVAVDPGLHLEEAAAFVQEMADADPRLSGIVAHAPLEKGESCRSRSRHRSLAALRSVRGVRRLIEFERNPAFCHRKARISPEGLRLLPKYRSALRHLHQTYRDGLRPGAGEDAVRRFPSPSITSESPTSRTACGNLAGPDRRTRAPAERRLQDIRRNNGGGPRSVDRRSGAALCRPCRRAVRLRSRDVRQRLDSLGS